jgi:hypothetical protein
LLDIIIDSQSALKLVGAVCLSYAKLVGIFFLTGTVGISGIYKKKLLPN